jgi:hypothetical protein
MDGPKFLKEVKVLQQAGNRQAAGLAPGPGCPLFVKGNQWAAKKNMSAESHERRRKALQKGHVTLHKKSAGEIKVTKSMERIRKKRERAHLRETVAKEAREIQELGRRNADAVMRRLANIAIGSPNETAAIAAAQVILDRSYGKANQTSISAHIDANGQETSISQKELDARVEQTLKRIETLTGGKAKAPKSEEPLIDLRKLDRDPNGSPLN